MEKKKMNDKGFSLVELIIVIAIMAILIGVLAPQYLKFVERSRKSTDRQNVDEIIRAVEIYSADPEASDTITSGSTVTITTTSTAVSTTNATGNIDKALQEAGIKSLVLKSKKWEASGAAVTSITLTFTVDANGSITVTSTVPDILSSTSGTP